MLGSGRTHIKGEPKTDMKDVLRMAVCDDESAQMELMNRYLLEWAQDRKVKCAVKCYESAESFLFDWEEDKALDLLVLDIEMKEMNGMELARRIRSQEEKIPILFVTGYDRYIAQGYDVEALHYLIKPVHKEKLFEVLDRLKNSAVPEEKLLLATKEGEHTFLLGSIWYFEAAGHFSTLYTDRDTIALHMSISSLAKKLAGSSSMVLCHRSYLVNLAHVSSLSKGELLLDDGRKLPLSRSQAAKVQKAFIKYYV